MDCRDLERWLDDGRPAAARERAEAHARSCAACASLAADDAALDVALAARIARPGSRFTDRVMARVAGEVRPAPAPLVDPELLTPWWAQLLRQPEVVLGLTLGALWAGAAPRLASLFADVGPDVAGRVPRAGELAPATWPPLLVATVAMAAAAGVGWLLYRAARAASARLGAVS